MNITDGRTETIVNALAEKHCAEWCCTYGEPGYIDPDKSIIFANWNDISQPIQDYLEEAGFEMEWSDEWAIDYGNSKAYRMSPDCYSWQCQIAYTEGGEMLTPDDDLEDWANEYEMTDKNQPTKALPHAIAAKDGGLKSLGYEKQNTESYENGFHQGQTDDPAAIAAVLFDAGADSVLFVVSETSQFYIGFDVYTKTDQE